MKYFWVIALLVLTVGCEEPLETGARRTIAPRVIVEPVVLSTERTRVEAVGTSRAIRSITVYPAASGEVTAVRFQPGQFVEQGAILVELDRRDAELAVQLANVRLQDAERTYERYQSSAKVGATIPTTLDAARTDVDAARIDLDRARINLEDRTVRAPFPGHVGITDVDAGDRIQPATRITTLDDRSALTVSFAVPEILIGKVRAGDPVAISTWSADGATSNGAVVEIDSRIDPGTRTFLTRAEVGNPGDALRPGMSFRVSLDLAGNPYPVLSEIALQWGADGSYIWSVIDGKAVRVPVSIVQRQRGKVLVQSGLTEGDLVVVEGIQRLRPGTPVSPEIATADNAPGPDDVSSGPGE